MEEIGYRTDVFSVFSLDGIAGSQREYILWLLNECSKGQAKPAAGSHSISKAIGMVVDCAGAAARRCRQAWRARHRDLGLERR